MSLFLGPRAFLVGAWHALTAPRLVLLLFLANLLLSAPVAAPVYLRLSAALGHDAAAARLLGAHDPMFAADLLRVRGATFDAAAGGLLAVAVIAFLVQTFLSGAILTALADRGRPCTLAALFAAGGRCFPAFLRVLVPAGGALALLLVANEGATRLLHRVFDDAAARAASADALFWAHVGKTALFAALFVLLVLAPVQLARARCVVDDERGMLRGYLIGLGLSLRNPLSILVFAVLFAAAAAAATLGYQAFLERMPLDAPLRPLARFDVAFQPAISPGWLAVIVAQLFVLVQQSLTVLRAGAFLTIYREKTDPPPAPDPELVYARPTVVDAPAPRRGPSRAAPPPFRVDAPPRSAP